MTLSFPVRPAGGGLGGPPRGRARQPGRGEGVALGAGAEERTHTHTRTHAPMHTPDHHLTVNSHHPTTTDRKTDSFSFKFTH